MSASLPPVLHAVPTSPADAPAGDGCATDERTQGAREAAARRASYDPETAEALRLWVVLSRAYAAVQAHAQDDITRHGLNLPEFGALEMLYHKGPLLVGDLQRHVLMSSGGMTSLLDRLQTRGLVARRNCPADRRAVWVGLTPAGTQLMDEVFPVHAARIRAALGGVAVTERRSLLDALKRLGRFATESACALAASMGAECAGGSARPSRRGRRPAGPTSTATDQG